MKLILVATILIFNSVTALAQPSLPIEAGSAKHGCAKPPLPRGAQKMQDAEVLKFVAQLDVYTTCIQTFSRDQQAIAAKHSKAAQGAVAAADAAVDEYNQFVEAAERVSGRK
jgi:hypothetical protein